MKKQKQMPSFRFHQDRRGWRLFACAALASLGCAFSPVHAASPAAESIYSGYAIFACLANDIEHSKSLLKKAGTLFYFEQSMGPAFPECRPE